MGMTSYLSSFASRRGLLAAIAVWSLVVLLPAPSSASDGWSNVDESDAQIRDIVFPVAGEVFYIDTWLYPRGGGRRHLGVDMMTDKLTPLLAVNAGCISYLAYGGPGGGNMLTLTDDDGWQYRYIHINNDSPGTDDGANPYEWAFEGGLEQGDCVQRGQHIAYAGDSGNAEYAGSHLHFEVIRPDGYWINPFNQVEAGERLDVPTCLPTQRTAPVGVPDAASARGYWLLDSTGSVHAFNADHLGDFASEGIEATPASMTSTPTGDGYWIVDTSGRVYAFGDATFLGDMSGFELKGPIRRIEPDPTGSGYWLVGDDGGVFTFGESGFHGSTGAMDLTSPVISMTATADGAGYWLVASDGGVFTFGSADFRGSTGAMALDSAVIDMAVSPDGRGYWLYAGDGGVFSFGVEFHGSAPGLGRCDLAPAAALRVSDTGHGYWIATEDGEVLEFGDAAHHGDQPTLGDSVTVVDMAIHHAVISG